MEFYFIESIEVLLTTTQGESLAFPIELFPHGIENNMPVVRKKNGTFEIYNGAFQDENGDWWRLECKNNAYLLSKCSP